MLAVAAYSGSDNSWLTPKQETLRVSCFLLRVMLLRAEIGPDIT